jgi:hypothetical protein
MLGLSACRSGVSNADVGRYMQADARPSDPSTRVQFGRGRLPGDFPTGLPVADHATLLGWIRTTSDTAYSWEAVYEAPGDPSSVADALTDGLKRGGWQVNDRADRNGFIALNFIGSGKDEGRTGVVDVGPAVTRGRVQVIVEVGEDRTPGG